MAFTAKFTAVRGKPDRADIVISAGTAEAVHDAISVNIDGDKMSKGEALILLDNIRASIFAAKWPIN